MKHSCQCMLSKAAAAAAALLLLAAPAYASARRVKTGLEVLRDANYAQLSGRKVMVLSNPTGITPELDLGVDVMFESGAVHLVGVMGPEHGFRGTAQAGGSDGTFIDPQTGLTVYDGYLANTTTLMGYISDSGADTVVFDIQDVGARFYTYIWAMYDTMVAAALSNTTFVVLDRPNPITGINAFGPVLNQSYSSYVGRRPIAQAHGMTAGELAHMFVGEGWIKEATNGSDLSLSVIQMKGWKRSMTWEETGLPARDFFSFWGALSDMPTVDTATLYPGTCMFEGTSISEGRGTTRPFELLGAPFTNASWAAQMRALAIPHTSYRTACFNPTISKFAGETVCGIQTYVSLPHRRDHDTFDPVFVGLNLLWTARHLYTNASSTDGADGFTWLRNSATPERFNIDVLAGGPLVREGIDAGLKPDEIRELWMPGLEKFREKRKKYLLY